MLFKKLAFSFLIGFTNSYDINKSIHKSTQTSETESETAMCVDLGTVHFYLRLTCFTSSSNSLLKANNIYIEIYTIGMKMKH